MAEMENNFNVENNFPEILPQHYGEGFEDGITRLDAKNLNSLRDGIRYNNNRIFDLHQELINSQKTVREEINSFQAMLNSIGAPTSRITEIGNPINIHDIYPLQTNLILKFRNNESIDEWQDITNLNANGNYYVKLVSGDIIQIFNGSDLETLRDNILYYDSTLYICNTSTNNVASKFELKVEYDSMVESQVGKSTKNGSEVFNHYGVYSYTDGGETSLLPPNSTQGDLATAKGCSTKAGINAIKIAGYTLLGDAIYTTTQPAKSITLIDAALKEQHILINLESDSYKGIVPSNPDESKNIYKFHSENIDIYRDLEEQSNFTKYTINDDAGTITINGATSYSLFDSGNPQNLKFTITNDNLMVDHKYTFSLTSNSLSSELNGQDNITTSGITVLLYDTDGNAMENRLKYNSNYFSFTHTEDISKYEIVFGPWSKVYDETYGYVNEYNNLILYPQLESGELEIPSPWAPYMGHEEADIAYIKDFSDIELYVEDNGDTSSRTYISTTGIDANGLTCGIVNDVVIKGNRVVLSTNNEHINISSFEYETNMGSTTKYLHTDINEYDALKELLSPYINEGLPLSIGLKLDDIYTLIDTDDPICVELHYNDSKRLFYFELPTSVIQKLSIAEVDLGKYISENTCYLWLKDHPGIGTLPINANFSSAEGFKTTTLAPAAHSEGWENVASGYFSHAEGRGTIAFNTQSHAEGRNTKAMGNASHAEGNTTKAIGSGTHAEGFGSSADGSAAHVEGYYSKVFGNYAHAGGSHSVAGIQAFTIEEINFVPKEDEPEVPTGATATYYVSDTGVNTNDGLTANTPVLTIAKAVELANGKNYTSADIVKVFVSGEKVNIGALPQYSYTLIVEGIGTGAKPIILFNSDKSAANNTYASEEHGDAVSAKTVYKNVTLSIAPLTWSSIYLNGSNAIFEDTADFVRGECSTLVYGNQMDGGAKKSYDGQLVEIRGIIPYAITFSNASWANKTYTGDISLVIDNNSYDADVRLNSYQSGKPSGTTTYQANINLKVKAANNIKFSNEQGATVNGALQIINTDYDLNLTPYEGSLSLIDSPQWILKTYARNDVLDFTHTTGVFKIKEGYNVTAFHQTGRVFTSKDGFLDLSAYSGAYEFSAIESTKFEGTIKLSSLEGLTTAMKVSLKSNSDFILDAGEIVSISQSNRTIKVEGYPSQINRFTQGAYLFIRSNPELGDVKIGSSAFASGSHAHAIGNYAMALGRHVIAAGDAQCVCGAFNLNKPDTMFELGCGTEDARRANAFEVYKDGSIAIYDTKITRGDLSKLLDLLYQNRAL